LNSGHRQGGFGRLFPGPFVRYMAFGSFFFPYLFKPESGRVQLLRWTPPHVFFFSLEGWPFFFLVVFSSPPVMDTDLVLVRFAGPFFRRPVRWSLSSSGFRNLASLSPFFFSTPFVRPRPNLFVGICVFWVPSHPFPLCPFPFFPIEVWGCTWGALSLDPTLYSLIWSRPTQKDFRAELFVLPPIPFFPPHACFPRGLDFLPLGLFSCFCLYPFLCRFSCLGRSERLQDLTAGCGVLRGLFSPFTALLSVLNSSSRVDYFFGERSSFQKPNLSLVVCLRRAQVIRNYFSRLPAFWWIFLPWKRVPWACSLCCFPGLSDPYRFNSRLLDHLFFRCVFFGPR